MPALASHLHALLARRRRWTRRVVARGAAWMVARLPDLRTRLATAKRRRGIVVGIVAGFKDAHVPFLGVGGVRQAVSLVAGLDAVVPDTRKLLFAGAAAGKPLNVARDALPQLRTKVNDA